MCGCLRPFKALKRDYARFATLIPNHPDNVYFCCLLLTAILMQLESLRCFVKFVVHNFGGTEVIAVNRVHFSSPFYRVIRLLLRRFSPSQTSA